MTGRDRFDVLDAGPNDAGRLASLSWRALDGELDAALQAIVASAARTADAPIALVSLVLKRIQLFRAHVGLPPELALAGATDRCVSFCQIVVRDQAPLAIVDALDDPRVPQALVARYGIRAYYGLPLRVGGRVVGTLCVIDVRPRAFDDQTRVALASLADEAARRLTSLTADDPIDPARAAPVSRAELTAAIAGVVAARISAIELRPRLRASSSASAGAALAVLGDAARALDDIDEELGEVEVALRGLLDASRR